MDKWAGFSIRFSSVDLTTGQWSRILPANPNRVYFSAVTNPGFTVVMRMGDTDNGPILVDEVTPLKAWGADTISGGRDFFASIDRWGPVVSGEIFVLGATGAKVFTSEVSGNSPHSKEMQSGTECRQVGWRAFQVNIQSTANPIQILPSNPSRFLIRYFANSGSPIGWFSFGMPAVTSGQINAGGLPSLWLGYNNTGELIRQPLFVQIESGNRPMAAMEAFVI
jgi:hypothetical protein